jgi:hypothetical protein
MRGILIDGQVLHVRGTPHGVTEAELSALCSPCGSVVKTLILRQQAFVQMDSVKSVCFAAAADALQFLRVFA